jgi:putative transposase
MGRKTRLEVEGGLYHVMSRGNNRQRIFDEDHDYEKMITLARDTKTKLPFYLYAYCLMTNHIHLLMEQQQTALSRIMHRLLTTYSRYYNRRHGRIGHLFKERYKAILCQSDQYLAELVRYIHLNPVRAKMVGDPAEFGCSSHRAYLGIDKSGLVDVEPVLRHFGASKKLAQERFKLFVKLGTEQWSKQNFEEDKRLLGSEEFVESTKKRVGDVRKGWIREMHNRRSGSID